MSLVTNAPDTITGQIADLEARVKTLETQPLISMLRVAHEYDPVGYSYSLGTLTGAVKLSHDVAAFTVSRPTAYWVVGSMTLQINHTTYPDAIAQMWCQVDGQTDATTTTPTPVPSSVAGTTGSVPFYVVLQPGSYKANLWGLFFTCSISPFTAYSAGYTIDVFQIGG